MGAARLRGQQRGAKLKDGQAPVVDLHQGGLLSAALLPGPVPQAVHLHLCRQEDPLLLLQLNLFYRLLWCLVISPPPPFSFLSSFTFIIVALCVL